MEIAWIIVTLSISVVHTESFQECGVRQSSGRIVGGRDTRGYHYPWFALLVLKENSNVPICAGSLITSNHVLTAAHCFTILPSTPNESLFNVIIGVYDRCIEKEPTRQTFGVVRVHIHEDYNRNEKFHDIALMTLDRKADYTVICLPNPETSDLTEPAILIGFGVTKESGIRAPCRMREARVTKFSKNDCRKTLLPYADIEEPTVICAGRMRGGVDSCQGDSGGPLQTVMSDGKYAVAGIVSFGYGCANRGRPGLYTDVISYLNWIHNSISGSLKIRLLDISFARDSHSSNWSENADPQLRVVSSSGDNTDNTEVIFNE